MTVPLLYTWLYTLFIMNKTYLYILIVLTVFYIGYSLVISVERDVPQLPQNPLYKNSQAALEDRVADLVSHLSLEEKIGQMALVEKNSLTKQSDIRTYGLGGILSGFGGKPEDNTTTGWKTMVETFVSESRSSRLEIPILYGVDAIHGHSNIPGATVFPHFIGLGASGDPILVKKIAKATADELLATGVRWSYSPTLDMPEDIRWGRVYEAFSDDPVLVSRLGNAYIEGLQNFTTSTSTIAVLATPKHYLGAGGMLWGSSSNENFSIDQGVTPIDTTKLRAHYIPPFEKAVQTGVLSVMVGLNSWGDTKLAASSYLIQTILKDELGFATIEPCYH